MPLDVIKTNMQARYDLYKNPVHCAVSIFKDSGVKGLYRGTMPFLIQTAGKASIRFTAFGFIKRALLTIPGTENCPIMTNMACGLLAGVAEASIWTTPAERIKVLQ
eukprot:CAMPEP_0201281708 /NCGR_PEP_ID=MMETSP1317-20130820/3852_1 /ASSEMBLY_ACC=CAM_ASM_000770 /TAXON_ID=187299 /ORGANISM="Undescribed Undescribed, Strain Undescribed" /LENGTH=105 /DNA_ID=CAMNT_0047592367 /DNA_START=44 /DNA_END=361 /DNA_ORIENTATION=+